MVKRRFLPFEEAREYVRKLGIKGTKKWFEYTKSGKLPDNIPKIPGITYKDKFQGYTDWVGGTHAKFLTRGQLLPFEEAREYVRKLGLKGTKEWYEFCKSGKKPNNIPTAPFSAYKKEWKGFADWLGKIRVRGARARPYEEAREYARSLKLSSIKEWNKFIKTDNLPFDIPRRPEIAYAGKFNGYQDWLGCKTLSVFLSYEKAGEYLQSIGISSSPKFFEFIKSGNRPKNIPSNPPGTYKNIWKGWPDFLRTENLSPVERRKNMLPFEEAHNIISKKNIQNSQQWREYCASGEKSSRIPSHPELTYSKEWKGWPYWLGAGDPEERKTTRFISFNDAKKYVQTTGLKSRKAWATHTNSKHFPSNIPKRPERFYLEFIDFSDWLGVELTKGIPSRMLPFEEAREHVRKLGLHSNMEYLKWKKHGPNNIPAQPRHTYKNEWKGWPDFLDSENRSGKYLREKFLPFEEAREYVRKLGFKGQKEWLNWVQTKRPDFIPSGPYKTYRNQWINLADWLATKRTRSTNFLSFEEAREYARGLKLSSMDEWYAYYRDGKIPQNIPNSPDSTYPHEWINSYDWLGNDDPSWSISNVKELLRELIKSKIIYQWDEAVLYSFLLRRGIYGTAGKHHDFFKNLIRAARTPEGLKVIKDYANSDEQNPPSLSPFAGETMETDEEVKTSKTEIEEGQKLEKQQEKDPLEKKYLETVQDILSNTDVLESISVDDEAMQFYVQYSINRLWERAFDKEDETINDVEKNTKSGNKYRDLVVETFLKDYHGVKKLPIPKGYSFPNEPFLMQRYAAYKVKTQSSFGNFSGTGAGKTLSAILAGRIIDSKVTLIVCPNDVVKHWVKNIGEIFPDSEIISGKDVFNAKYDKEKHQYLVLNYDKLNQAGSANQILKISKEKIDFVILDEIHFSKITSYRAVSLRRENLEGLMSYAREVNPEIKVLGMSATPVVNNLNEGKSLLELMTGKIYDDLTTRPTIPNAVALYEKLATMSIRQIPNYNISLDKEFVEVDANRPDEKRIKYLNNNPLAIEQILTEARLPEIIKRINGQTIIYTEYVTNIVNKIAQAVNDAGYKFGFYVGGDDTGLEPFKRKEIQVLIASRPISTGIDGLQTVCNRLIFNTLPWTSAQYQQLIGRIVRTGQGENVVHIHHILAGIGGYLYDHLKLNRIKFKRTLADCAVDGILPERNLITPQKATKEAIAWLARLESGKITSVTRRELDLQLTPVEIKNRIRTFGDFAKLNQKFNTENSSTTHQRLLKNPEEWKEYHRQYREARKSWTVIPYEVWIERIKALSERLIIADFGCGEAKIQDGIGGRVHSLDHVSIDQSVTSCDMKSTPLADGSIDIAIFSLSLMGRNWQDYIVEAKRCLATNGYLFISETSNAMENRLSELREVLSEEGFEIYYDEQKGDFTFIEARKL